MLKENWRLISRIERLGDACIIIFSFFLAYYGRPLLILLDEIFGWQIPFQGETLAPLNTYLVVLVFALGSYFVSLNGLGAYSSMRLTSPWRLLWISTLSSVLVFFSLAALLFLLKLDLSRSFLLLFCALTALSITAERYLVLRVLRLWRRQGRNFRNVIICGNGQQAATLAGEIARQPELGLLVRAFSTLRSVSVHEMEGFRSSLKGAGHRSATKMIEGKDALMQALRDYAIDEVIFTDVVSQMGEVEEMVLICSEQGIRTTIAADLFSIGMVKSGISYFGSMPLIHFQTPPGDRWELSLKRGIDVALSALLLVVLSPVFLIIALIIKVTSPGPVIFTQKRVGLNGRLFDLYKFRSMVQDAEGERVNLAPLNEMSGPTFKIKDDPRITPVGRWLRRYSLDELPQLWNVLIGNMSLVGPRPPIPGEVSMYERRDRRRLSMRPGLTCIWQVSGRNEIRDFESWVRLDLEYIDNWSLGRDLLLLFRTIPAVLIGTGAR